MYTMTAT